MNSPAVFSIGVRITLLILLFPVLYLLSSDAAHAAAKKERYDIIYLLSNDLDRVLDYKESLESTFPTEVLRKIKVMGQGDQYALIYDGNDSAATVARTLIEHAEVLNNAGFDEPYATKEQNFHTLYNVTYGIGPNLDPLKKKYELLYKRLGADVKRDLFIEKTGYGNYRLIYRNRGSKRATYKIAKKHSRILRPKRISTSVAKEMNNPIVFGESSLINEEGQEKSSVAKGGSAQITGEGPGKKIVALSKVKKKLKHPVRATQAGATNYTKVERSIENYINKLRRRGKLSSDESTGWMVYDLAKDQPVVDINADKEFQAASMIKPFVALAFFHRVKEGSLKYGPRSRRKMEAMIQRSNNPATNWVMRHAGGPKRCESILRRHYGWIFKQIEIKEYIPAGGRTYLNSASPSDYVRFLRALWNKKLPYNREIRRLMALPGRDRLYHGTPIPRGTLVYNKTGSTAHLCGDMGILVPQTRRGGRYPYVVVGIIERQSRPSNYGRWMDTRGKVIRNVSTLVYKQMKQEHQLL